MEILKTVTFFIDFFYQIKTFCKYCKYPEYCLLNIPEGNSANSQKNVFNPFDFPHIFNNDNSDLDISLFNNKFDVVDSPYFFLEEIPCKVEKFLENSFSVLHVNIRSLTKILRNCLNF